MTEQEYKEWLTTLKEGDAYLAYSYNRVYGAALYKVTITKTSEKSVYVGEERYNRRDGKCIGSDGHLPKPATDEQKRKAKLNLSKSKVRVEIGSKLDKLTQEQVDKILEILKEMTV